MLDKREIRENPDAVRTPSAKKGIDLDVDELLDLDRSARKLQHELDQAQARRKSSAKEFAQADDARRAQLRAEHAELEIQLKALREQLAETTERLNGLMLLTPTIPWEGAPVGPDDSANVSSGPWGPRRSSTSSRSTMFELLEKRGWADFTGPARWRASVPTRWRATWCCSSARCTPTPSTCSGAKTSRWSACPRWSGRRR